MQSLKESQCAPLSPEGPVAKSGPDGRFLLNGAQKLDLPLQVCAQHVPDGYSETCSHSPLLIVPVLPVAGRAAYSANIDLLSPLEVEVQIKSKLGPIRESDVVGLRLSMYSDIGLMMPLRVSRTDDKTIRFTATGQRGRRYRIVNNSRDLLLKNTADGVVWLSTLPLIVDGSPESGVIFSHEIVRSQ